MHSVPLLIGLATAATTYIGGHFALRWRHRLNGLLGFGAGALLGVAVFDLLPEALHLSASKFGMLGIIGIIVVGFCFCLGLYWLMPPHSHEDETDRSTGAGKDSCPSVLQRTGEIRVGLPLGKDPRNLLGVGSLSIHSLMDGLGIGLALKVSMSVGIVAAIGVLVHDFSDGINTVAIVLRNDGSASGARRWLIVDSCAPMLGVISAYFITLSPHALGILLAVFCGMFCYIGACDLLPEGYRRHTRIATTLLALLGAGTVLMAVTLARM